ncbi:MAG: hypothetical protein KAQ96_12875, partial [Thermoplasmata archaeon]|nr:hypothetical protein [Thermoplasmata archaeon]
LGRLASVPHLEVRWVEPSPISDGIRGVPRTVPRLDGGPKRKGSGGGLHAPSRTFGTGTT